MKCNFCAEEIQDAAILCRFCGATKQDEQWQPKPTTITATPKPKGRFTIQSAGVMFILSGGFEVFSITSEIPLFGALRGGAVAIAYHSVFATLFIAMGIGLLSFKRWGYLTLMGGTLFYTIDRLMWVLDKQAQSQYIRKNSELTTLIDSETISSILASTSLLFILCWWSFALYIYMRRDQFQSSSKSTGIVDGTSTVSISDRTDEILQ